MIDYTQYAFQSAPQVSDPVPSVADYLNQYDARNRAWYESWASPMAGGGFGSRPESFETRAPWLPPVAQDVTPPALRETGGDLTGVPMEDTQVRPEDRPIGAITTDPAMMSNADLWTEYTALSNPYAAYAASAPAMAFGLGTGFPGMVGGMMARANMEQRGNAIMNEIGRRMAPLYEAPVPVQVSQGRETSYTIPGMMGRLVGSDLLPNGLPADIYTGGEGGANAGGGGYSSADRSGDQETTSQRGGIGGV